MTRDPCSPDQAPATGCNAARDCGPSWSWWLCTSLILVTAAPLALAADELVVSQHNRAFSPEQIEVARGSTIRIVNDDKVTHHVYVDSPTMKFDSGAQPVGSAVELKFSEAGTFDFLCAIHPTMHLAVTVK